MMIPCQPESLPQLGGRDQGVLMGCGLMCSNVKLVNVLQNCNAYQVRLLSIEQLIDGLLMPDLKA